MDERRGISRKLAFVVGGYALLLAAGVRSHWAGGPPYERPSVGLQVTFATIAALIGLASIWSAFAVVHWSSRAAGLITAVAVVVGAITLFFEWNSFFIWQLVAIVYSQLAFLIIALVTIRLCGYALLRDSSPCPAGAEEVSGRSLQFSVGNLLLLTTSLALLFGVLHYARSVQLSATILTIVVLAGLCAACVALVAVWASFSTAALAIRVVVAIAVAPVGGIAYHVVERYERLLMSAPWYAGVTALQLVLMVVPLLLLRSRAYRFTQVDQHGRVCTI